MLFMILVSLLIACRESGSNKNSSAKIYRDKSRLMKLFRNLSEYEITACAYRVSCETKPVRFPSVPAPSDTKIEVWGSVTFSEIDAQKIQQNFSWKPADPALLPAKLKHALKENDLSKLKVSADFSKTFESNPTFTNDVVVCDPANPNQLYFYAIDRDHSISKLWFTMGK